MVEPSIDDDDREAFLLRFRIGFALLVGASMGLISLHADAGMSTAAGATAGGALVGALLAWWVFPDSIAMNRY